MNIAAGSPTVHNKFNWADAQSRADLVTTWTKDRSMLFIYLLVAEDDMSPRLADFDGAGRVDVGLSYDAVPAKYN